MKLLSTLWIELLSTAAGIAGISRTQETKGQQQWGPRRVPWNTAKTLLQRLMGEGLCSLLGQSAQVSTHSPLWIELLSAETGIAGIPRTQETKEQPWG